MPVQDEPKETNTP